MKVAVDGNKVRVWRIDRHWTQEGLAEASKVSLRTIQRIENGAAASRQTVLALASTFGVDTDALMAKPERTEQEATAKNAIKKHLQFKLSFWIHLATYLFVIGLLLAINIASRPEELWVTWPAIGWGIGVLAHGATVFLVGAIGRTDDKLRTMGI